MKYNSLELGRPRQKLFVFFKSTSYYAIALTATALFQGLLIPLLTHNLPLVGFGVIAIILVLIPFSRTTISCEISQSICILFNKNPKFSKESYFSMGALFTVVCCLVLFSVLLICSHYIGKYVFSQYHIRAHSLIILALAMLIDALNYYFMLMMRWEKRGIDFLMASILNSALPFALICWFFAHNRSIDAVLYSWLIGWSVNLLFCIYRMRRLIEFKFKLKALKEMLSFSFPLFINILPTRLNGYIDRIVITCVIGFSFTALYSAAYSTGSLINLFVGLVQMIVIPYAYKSHGEVGKEVKLVNSFYAFIPVLALLLCLLIMSYSLWVPFFLPQSYISNKQVIFALLLTIIALGIKSISCFFPGIMLSKKTMYYVIISSVSLAVNLVVSFPMIYFLGIIGASVAILLSSMADVGLGVMFSQRLHNISFCRSSMTSVLAPSVLIILLSFFLSVVSLYGYINNVTFSLLGFAQVVLFLAATKKRTEKHISAALIS